MKKMCFIFAFLAIFCLTIASNLYAAKCEFVKDDKVKVNENGYIMSWLVLDPYINTGITTPLVGAKEFIKDEKNLKPKEGNKVKIEDDKQEHTWMRLNFLDLKDMAQIPAAVGGNELDLVCWGGQGPSNCQTYLVTYLKWKSNTKVKFTASADDGARVYFNGEKIIESQTDKDWAAGNCGSGEASAKGGVWNILVVLCLETGGEWGISIQVDTVPDEVDNVGPMQLFAVDSLAKLATTWGEIKR